VKDRLLKYAKYAGPIGFPLFFVVCLAIFAALLFPYRRLKERIVTEFNANSQASGGQAQELQIEDMSGYWLSGVKMTNAALLSAPAEPGKPPSRVQIDEATVRYQLLPLLIGHSDIHFDAFAFGGEASGSYDVGGKDKSVDVDLDTIDIGKVQALVDLLGVPLAGKLGGTVHLTMPEGRASKGTGSVSIEIQDASVGDGKAKIKGALALPRIDVGTLTFAAEAKDGLMKITKLMAGGKDLEVQGEGRINMRELATDSLIDLQIRFKINDAYRNKSDVTKSLFGAPGSNAPALFEMADPKIKQAKRADGFYGWSLRGPLGKPEFFPSPGGAQAPAPGAAFGTKATP
jgi:type II secretion system protein N